MKPSPLQGMINVCNLLFRRSIEEERTDRKDWRENGSLLERDVITQRIMETMAEREGEGVLGKNVLTKREYRFVLVLDISMY